MKKLLIETKEGFVLIPDFSFEPARAGELTLSITKKIVVADFNKPILYHTGCPKVLATTFDDRLPLISVSELSELFKEQKAELMEQLIKVTNALEKTNNNSSEGNAIVLADAKAVIAKYQH